MPIPCSVKTRSTKSRVGSVGERWSTRLAASAERRSESVQPFARARAGRHDGRVRHELARFEERQLPGLVVHGVHLRDGHDACFHSEQAQDRQVLVRLRARPLAGVDHEQEEVDARGAGDHRADEALVAGDVDDREAPPVRELERRVAEVDRDTA